MFESSTGFNSTSVSTFLNLDYLLKSVYGNFMVHEEFLKLLKLKRQMRTFRHLELETFSLSIKDLTDLKLKRWNYLSWTQFSEVIIIASSFALHLNHSMIWLTFPINLSKQIFPSVATNGGLGDSLESRLCRWQNKEETCRQFVSKRKLESKSNRHWRQMTFCLRRKYIKL